MTDEHPNPLDAQRLKAHDVIESWGGWDRILDTGHGEQGFTFSIGPCTFGDQGFRYECVRCGAWLWTGSGLVTGSVFLLPCDEARVLPLLYAAEYAWHDATKGSERRRAQKYVREHRALVKFRGEQE